MKRCCSNFSGITVLYNHIEVCFIKGYTDYECYQFKHFWKLALTYVLLPDYDKQFCSQLKALTYEVLFILQMNSFCKVCKLKEKLSFMTKRKLALHVGHLIFLE